MNQQPILSVIILNWNTCELTKQCLESIFDTWRHSEPRLYSSDGDRVPPIALPALRHSFGEGEAVAQESRVLPPSVEDGLGSFGRRLRLSQDDKLEVIVVDNASSDNSTAMIVKEFPQVKLITNQTNLGFAKGNNVGINQAIGKYILLLNSDILVQSGALQSMVAVAQSDRKIGAIGPRLLNQDGTDQWQFHREFPTLGQIVWVYTTVLGRLTPRIRWLRAKYLGQQNREQSGATNLQLSGAALMVSANLLKKLGGLDENFYFWLEDVDLCWRVKKLGYQLYYNAQAKIIHLGGASSAMWSDFKRLYNFRVSMVKYFQKHLPRQARLVRLIFQLDALVMVPLSMFVRPKRVRVYIKFLREF